MTKNLNNIVLYPYKSYSKAAQALAAELGIKRILHEGSHYKGSKDQVVINWGASIIPPHVAKSIVINKAMSVGNATDKLRFFKHLFDIDADVRVPDWTECPKTAQEWIAKGAVLMARTKLVGHSGDGIVICRKGFDFHPAKLYTVYVPKKYEFRVHVVNGNVIDIQRKALRSNFEKDDNTFKIRSHQNGWVYVRSADNIKLPQENDIGQQALNAITALDLDFGAVDIIWSQKFQQAIVLEINSAPGLEGESVKIYGNAFREWLCI